MTTEMTPRKACGNAILKKLPPDQQEDIAKHIQGNTLEETQEYLASKYKIKVCLMTIGRFRTSYEKQMDARLNLEALETVSEMLAEQHPDWTPEKIQSMGQAYFAAYAIRQNDVRMWWQIQSLTLKEKKLALDRDKHERSAAENIVNTCNNAKVRAAATRSDQWYADRVKGARVLMFGYDKDELKKSPECEVQSQSNAQGKMQKVEEGKGESANIQHSTLNPQHSIAEKAPTSKLQAPAKDQTLNLQHSTLNIQPFGDSQPSTKNPQPSEIGRPPLENPGSLSLEEALRFLTAVDIEARKAGRRLPKPWHVASMRAYLTGKEIMWLNPKNLRKEPVQPPTMDPRLNPESPWSRLWKDLGPAMNANEKN